MSPKRIQQLYADFEKAVGRLNEALAQDPRQGAGAVLDGTIQRFEFTFELSWKLIKNILNYKGIEAGNPRDVIKEAFQQAIIKDGNGWIAMLEDRNRTSHVYDEKEVLRIYEKIKEPYRLLFDALLKEVDGIIRNLS